MVAAPEKEKVPTCNAKLSIMRSRSRNSPVKGPPRRTQAARNSANAPFVMHWRMVRASKDEPLASIDAPWDCATYCGTRLFGQSRLGENARHRRFEHDVKCVGFTFIAHPLQTKSRLNLLLRDGCLRLASFNFSLC